MIIKLRQAYSFCQTGQRNYQEDARFPDMDRSTFDSLPFFMVCDGVGGCDKGEVASHIVCEFFARTMAKTDFQKDFTNEDFSRALDAAYNALDKNAKGENRGMATTLTFVCFHGGGCTMAHIGDSRIYHIRPESGILYRSDDHSLVNTMVHSGTLSPEDALTSPQRHVITRYMESVEPDENRHMASVMRTDDVKEGDYFFLCSDGVLEKMDEDKLMSVLSNPDISDEDKMGVIAQMSESSSDNNTAWLIPIAEVEIDEKKYIAAENSEDSQTTRRLPISREGIAEVESVQSSPGNRIWSWIINMFN